MKKQILYVTLFGLCSTIITNDIYVPKKDHDHNESYIINGSVNADTFFTGGSNVALLNSQNDFDQAAFIQSIVDGELTFSTPKQSTKRKLEFLLAARANTVLGSPSTTQMLTPDLVKIGQTITEIPHSHTFEKPLFWLRKAWMKVYSESEDTFVQCGYFPKQIGLGLILGNNFHMGTPLMINNSEFFVDQYRPGFQFSTKFKDGKYGLTGYCALEQINSTSVEQQIGMTRSQELQEGTTQRYIRKEKAAFQNSFLVSVEGSLPLFESTEEKERSLHMTPFIMYKYDPNQTVEFFADATSRLWTVGASFDFTCKKMFGSIDFATQIGFQKVKAWDRNVAVNDGSMVLTHLFHKQRIVTTDYISESAIFPLVADISLNYAAGEKFIALEGAPHFAHHSFQNSYSRFRKAYKNSLSGILLATDFGYNYNDNITFGGIFGLITGDQNPNDSTEKVLLYRLQDSWNSVREDRNHAYFGFQGTNSLYSGKNVHSYYLLRANKLEHDINTSPDLIPNSCTNLGYFGVSMKYEGTFGAKQKSWNIQPNMIFMMQTNKTQFGYDLTLNDTFLTSQISAAGVQTYSITPSNEAFKSALEKMPLALGIELNTKFEFYDSENLSLYGSLAFFFPGAHYSDIKEKSYKKQGKVIPLKNQLLAEKANLSGIENTEQNTITLLNDVSMNCYLGCSLSFDSVMEFFTTSKQTHKQKTIDTNKFSQK